MTTFDRAVEAGARAILEAWQQDWDALPDVVKKAAKKSASAAILAALKELREPSEAMIRAAYEQWGNSGSFDEQFGAAINALIKEAENALCQTLPP